MNHRAAPLPALTDAAPVRTFVERFHVEFAAAFVGKDQRGLLQLSRIHPTKAKLHVSGRFQTGDVDNWIEQAIADAEAGFNVYVEGRTVCGKTKREVRGDLSDNRGVFASVVDSDKGKASGGLRLITPWRWTKDLRPGFPPPVKINNRDYRRRSHLEAFKRRMEDRSVRGGK